MKPYFVIFTLTSLILSACSQSSSYSTSIPVALDTIPKTYENPDGSVPRTVIAPIQTAQAPNSEKHNENNQTQVLKPSQLINNAEWIMVHEGHRLGTACNRFIERVLEYSGFVGSDFMANDFDLYAQKYFKFYKSVDFKNDSAGSDIEPLHNYLWSYPERTPFIMQWSRSGMHGHIAIVERIADHLIIYQANLNKYTARKDQTTVQSLLSGFNRRTLTVYSEFRSN